MYLGNHKHFNLCYYDRGFLFDQNPLRSYLVAALACYFCYHEVMSERTPAIPAQLEAYFGALDTRLFKVPELQPGLDLVKNDHELANSIYKDYVSLISSMANLTDDERRIIHIAKESMMSSNGNFGTASKVSADDILTELGDRKGILADLAFLSTDSTSPYFAPALDELAVRMEGGHRLKRSGKQPSDDDPESRKVIWGHTMISDPLALVNFMVCHYMERYFAVALTEQGAQLAKDKDFMLNALIDVVLIDRLGANNFNGIYDMWSAPKDQGGLGWITQARLASYDIEPTA